MIESYDIIVIGGGAAGYFAAIHAANEGANKVVILEKTNKVLTKVTVSGGGRCNVTHACDYPAQLIGNYPRGGKKLRKAFDVFDAKDTVRWFESRGVALVAEADGRIFPESNSSQTIVDCLQVAAQESGVKLHLKREVREINRRLDSGFDLTLANGDKLYAKKVIVTTGGHNKPENYKWLTDLGLKISRPIPSLFTFNVPNSELKDLMGLSMPNGKVQIPGAKWKSEGPILITHWGFSAPAVIKLSAWAAIYLNEINYKFPILINWTGLSEDETRLTLRKMRENHPGKLLVSNPQFEIPSRLWERLCAMANIGSEVRYAELPSKHMNRLIENIIRCAFEVRGKTTFKEEFVTCGGVDLNDIEITSFECKKIPGLFLAGEVLNVDGVTGGFNFQHAWTSGFLVGTHAAKTLEQSDEYT